MRGTSVRVARRRSSFVVLLTVVIFPAAAFGWGASGHNVLCRAAWKEASQQAREMIKSHLDVSGAAGFGNLCNWADWHVSDMPWTRKHHYVNVPRGAALDASAHCPDYGCAMRSIGQYARFLVATESSAVQKAEALKFLAHHLGDLHQPLHVGYVEDRGGNAIKIRFCPGESCWSSIVKELHKTWDRGLLEAGAPLTASGSFNLAAIADELVEGISPADRSAWRSGDVITWAGESYALANDEAYRPWVSGALASGYIGDPPLDDVLDSAYVARMRPIAAKRLRMAAVRLAAALDDLAQGTVAPGLTVVPALAVEPAAHIIHYVSVRQEPEANAPRVAKLKKDETAEVIGPDDPDDIRWYRVRLANGTEGFVKRGYVQVLGD